MGGAQQHFQEIYPSWLFSMQNSMQYFGGQAALVAPDVYFVGSQSQAKYRI